MHYRGNSRAARLEGQLAVALALLIVIGVTTTGCTGKPPATNINPSKNLKEKKVGKAPPSIKLGEGSLQPKVATPVPDAPAEPLHEPIVKMSEAHAKSCLVKVGDPMPNIVLPDLNSTEQTLSRLYGERLTVVVFWNSKYVFAEEQYVRLGRETLDVFSGYGVSVVAINVGDEPEKVRSVAGNTTGEFPCLLDLRGDALGQVATSKLPRTYLLDAEGKVIWLDIEYSRSTERELRNAVHYFLRRSSGGEAESSAGGGVKSPSKQMSARDRTTRVL